MHVLGVALPVRAMIVSERVLPPNESYVEGSSGILAPVRSAFLTGVQLLEAGRASLLLRHGTEPVLVVAASIGIDEAIVSSIRVEIGRGIAGVVAERGVALFGSVRDQTFLSIPVETEQGIEGALNVTDRLGGKPYTIAHLKAAQSVGRHIGNLLQYSRYAARDPVSGLPNRRAFDEMLARELALSERTGSPFTLAFLDLDNLKAINDEYGHVKGDEVIRAVGETLQHILRPYDFAGRLGGDEFALLLTATTETDVDLVQRVTDAVSALSSKIHIDISTSVGVARWPVDGRTGSLLVSIADARMYENKRAKRINRR